VTTTPDLRLKPSEPPPLAVGSWHLAPADSFVSFTARLPFRRVRGRLPLTGQVIITEPVEGSSASLIAMTGGVRTGSSVLDHLLAGPAFLDARTFPDICFQSDLLIRVPSGWRAVGRLRIKNTEHELACQFGVQIGVPETGQLPRPVVTCSWVIDSAWVVTQRIPALDRRVEMTCSFRLDPDVQVEARVAV
jgi:polyisoprenoid-binding protein YceI